MVQTVEQYKEYLKSRLEPVSDILPNIAEGDFSGRLEIPTEKDEFRELYMGINFLLRDLNEQLNKREYAEKALRESEQKYKALFDASPEGIVIIDLDGKILECNAAIHKLTKLPMETLIGKQFMETGLLNPEELSKIIELFPKLLAGDFSGTVEVEIKSGVEKRCLEVFPAVIEKENEISALQIMVRDITERKKGEEAVRESEEKYRTLFESSIEGILIADINSKKFEYANPALCRMLGYTEEELLQMGVPDLHPKDALKQVISEFEAQARGEKSLASSIPCLRKDGKIIYADINTNKILINRKEKNVGFFTDITERKKGEEAVRESEEKFRDIFENANDLIQSVDSDGNFIYVNKMWLETLGYSQEELGERKLIDILRKDQIQHCMELFHRICKGESFDKMETVFVAKDGREITVEGNVNAQNKDGKFIATRGIFRDITERKKGEETLHKTMSDLERFNKVAVGREVKMIELKREVNGLLHSMGRQEKYTIPTSENVKNIKGG